MVLCELLCLGSIKTDFGFPESVLIQNEICKPEALDEHLNKCFLTLLEGQQSCCAAW